MLEEYIKKEEPLKMFLGVERIASDYKVSMSYIYNLIERLEKKKSNRGEGEELNYSLNVIKRYLEMKRS